MGRLLESAAGRPFSIGEISGMKRVAAVFLMAAACRAGPAPLRLGTTYTVQQSGALAVLESLWTGPAPLTTVVAPRSEEHTSELQSRLHLVCRLLLEKKKTKR